MKRIGSLEALFNVISDRSGCTQNQIFGYILGISWKMVFALAYTPFWKLNKCAINLAKNYNDKPGWTCFLYSFFILALRNTWCLIVIENKLIPLKALMIYVCSWFWWIQTLIVVLSKGTYSWNDKIGLEVKWEKVSG